MFRQGFRASQHGAGPRPGFRSPAPMAFPVPGLVSPSPALMMQPPGGGGGGCLPHPSWGGVVGGVCTPPYGGQPGPRRRGSPQQQQGQGGSPFHHQHHHQRFNSPCVSHPQQPQGYSPRHRGGRGYPSPPYHSLSPAHRKYQGQGSPRTSTPSFAGPLGREKRSSSTAVEHYYKPSMLEDPWADLEPVSVCDIRSRQGHIIGGGGGGSSGKRGRYFS